jgi:hypothetical protein
LLVTLLQRSVALLWFAGMISYAGDWALIVFRAALNRRPAVGDAEATSPAP